MTGVGVTQYPAASHVLKGLHSSPSQREPSSRLLGTRFSASARGHNQLTEHDVSQHETTLYATGDLPRPKNFEFAHSLIRIDWRALAGVDVDRLVRNAFATDVESGSQHGTYSRRTLQVGNTDIDQLERVVHILSHGDLQAENTSQLTETNFIKIFRLAQLAIQYLLHVQDVLSSERTELLKSEYAFALVEGCLACGTHGSSGMSES
jgi:hypothetical protein